MNRRRSIVRRNSELFRPEEIDNLPRNGHVVLKGSEKDKLVRIALSPTGNGPTEFKQLLSNEVPKYEYYKFYS